MNTEPDQRWICWRCTSIDYLIGDSGLCRDCAPELPCLTLAELASWVLQGRRDGARERVWEVG